MFLLKTSQHLGLHFHERMAALYPLRIISKYQNEIEQLENMGFDGNQAAEYLEQYNGNMNTVIEVN